MPKSVMTVNNFTAGELSPYMEGRVDLAQYHNAAKEIENFIIMPYGGLKRRPGTRFVAEVRDSTRRVRLIPFKFGADQAYTLEFGHQYIRFYMNRGRIMTGTPPVPYEIASPYLDAELNELQFSQNADIMWITHTNHKTRELRRFGHTNWVLANYAPVTDPFVHPTWIASRAQVLNSFVVPTTGIGEINLSIQTAASATGAIVEGSTVLGVPNDVRDNNIATRYGVSGAVGFALPGETPIPRIEYWVEVNLGVTDVVNRIELVHNWNFISGSILIFVEALFGGSWHRVMEILLTVGGARTDTLVANLEGISRVRVRVSGSTGAGQGAQMNHAVEELRVFGTGRYYDCIVAGTTGTVQPTWPTVIGTTVVDGTVTWRCGGITPCAFPASVSIFEQRLWFGGTRREPQTVWATRSGNFQDMTLGATDSHALALQLGSEEVNIIRWLIATKSLHIGTSGGIFNLTSTGGAPITPTNVRASREAEIGCFPMMPKLLNSQIFYVQRDNKRMRQFSYDFDSDSFIPIDVTLLAEHIIKSGIVSMAYQQSPYDMLWCVRNDGAMAVLTRLMEQQVTAWGRFITDGRFESVAVISSENVDDEVWVVVNRTIGGVTRRYIEYFERFEFNRQEDAFFVDSGLSYSGVATSTISGLAHLEGRTVSILANGAVQPDRVVTNGAVTLSEPATIAHIGLPYTSKVKFLKLEPDRETSVGRFQRISKVVLRFFRTLGGRVGVENNLELLHWRTPSVPMGSPPPLFTGEREMPFVKGVDKDIEIVIEQAQALPMTIIALIAFIDVSEFV